MALERSKTPGERAPLLTTEEVQSYLRVNARTLYRLIKTGDLPAVRVGRQWRIRPGDLDAWLSTGRRPARTV